MPPFFVEVTILPALIRFRHVCVLLCAACVCAQGVEVRSLCAAVAEPLVVVIVVYTTFVTLRADYDYDGAEPLRRLPPSRLVLTCDTFVVRGV